MILFMGRCLRSFSKEKFCRILIICAWDIVLHGPLKDVLINFYCVFMMILWPESQNNKILLHLPQLTKICSNIPILISFCRAVPLRCLWLLWEPSHISSSLQLNLLFTDIIPDYFLRLVIIFFFLSILFIFIFYLLSLENSQSTLEKIGIQEKHDWRLEREIF